MSVRPLVLGQMLRDRRRSTQWRTVAVTVMQAVLLPVAVGSVTVAGGLWRLRRRDLG